MTAQATAALSPLELAASLDATGLFLGNLERHPAFTADRAGLRELARACFGARGDLEERYELDGTKLEELGEEMLDRYSLGYGVENRGLGAAVLQLTQQVREIAEEIFHGADTEWDPEKREWGRL